MTEQKFYYLCEMNRILQNVISPLEKFMTLPKQDLCYPDGFFLRRVRELFTLQCPKNPNLNLNLKKSQTQENDAKQRIEQESYRGSPHGGRRYILSTLWAFTEKN